MLSDPSDVHSYSSIKRALKSLITPHSDYILWQLGRQTQLNGIPVLGSTESKAYNT